MSGKIFRLRALGLRERRTLLLLRGATGLGIGLLAEQATGALSVECRRIGLVLASLDSPYVTEDELKILAWLAVAQRQRPDWPDDEVLRSAALLDALTGAARTLGGAGCKLEFLNAQRVRRLRREHPLARRPEAMPLDAESDHPVTASARVWQQLAQRGPMSTKDLILLGVSRQLVSRLHHRGIIERVAHGFYVACGAGRTA